MKRLIKYIAIFMALVTLFVSPASAVETGSNWVNILDFDLGSDNSNYISFKETGTLTYQLPYSTFFRYLQGVIQCNSDTITSMTWSRGTSATRYGLTLIPLGNGLYRFYSEYNSLASDTINLHFNSSSSGTTYVEVVQFQYSLLRTWNYDEKGNLSVTANNAVYDYSMDDPSTNLVHYFSSESAYVAKLSCPDWRKYDYLTFFVFAFAVDINSISAHAGSFEVPITVDHISPNDYTHGDRFALMLTIDLTGLDRNMVNTPFVEISGNVFGLSELTRSIQLLSVSGNVSVAETDVLPYLLKTYFSSIGEKLDDMTFWIQDFYAQTYSLLVSHFQDIYDEVTLGFSTISGDFETYFGSLQLDLIEHFENITNTIEDSFNDFTNYWGNQIASLKRSITDRLDALLHPDTTQSEQFQDEIASQATEMQEVTDTLDSVTKPPVEDMNPSVDDIVSPEDVESYTSILQIFLGNQIFLSVCFMSLTLGLVSYTLYGKR